MLKNWLGFMASWNRIASVVLSWNEDRSAELQLERPFEVATLSESRMRDLLIFGFDSTARPLSCAKIRKA
jgi:hypothetical protein